MKIRFLFLILATLVVSVPIVAQSKPMLYRSPSMNQTHVAFGFGGDIFTVPKSGGRAMRLTSSVGNESGPRYSPDGTMIAFTGQYDGNTDVFVMPAMGGEPRRITHHPSNDGVVGWSNDGKSLIFLSNRDRICR